VGRSEPGSVVGSVVAPQIGGQAYPGFISSELYERESTTMPIPAWETVEQSPFEAYVGLCKLRICLTEAPA
jgi:hypothetical protein